MLKHYAQTLIKKLIVEKDNYSEHFFCIIVCLTFLFAALSTAFNLLVGLPMIVSTWSGVLSIFLLLVFFLYRHHNKKYRSFAKKLYYFSVIITLNGMWIYNRGTQSPSPIIFIAFIALIVYLDPKPGAGYISLLLGLNILALTIVDLYFPEQITPYQSNQQRIADFLFVIIYLFIAVIPTLSYAR